MIPPITPLQPKKAVHHLHHFEAEKTCSHTQQVSPKNDTPNSTIAQKGGFWNFGATAKREGPR
jgi:hypothetical protein